MMNGSRKSDRPVVATKLVNKVAAETESETTMAEQAERRGLARGRRHGKTRTGHRTGKSCAMRWGEYGKQPLAAATWRHHLRQEPDALVALVRIRGGGGQ